MKKFLMFAGLVITQDLLSAEPEKQYFRVVKIQKSNTLIVSYGIWGTKEELKQHQESVESEHSPERLKVEFGPMRSEQDVRTEFKLSPDFKIPQDAKRRCS